MQKLNTVLQEVAKEGRVKFPVIKRKEFLQASVDSLELDMRSSNALQRHQIYTVEDLLNKANELHRIRGCGSKSISRIMYRICAYYYESLQKQEKEQYLKEIIKLNKTDK